MFPLLPAFQSVKGRLHCVSGLPLYRKRRKEVWYASSTVDLNYLMTDFYRAIENHSPGLAVGSTVLAEHQLDSATSRVGSSNACFQSVKLTAEPRSRAIIDSTIEPQQSIHIPKIRQQAIQQASSHSATCGRDKFIPVFRWLLYAPTSHSQSPHRASSTTCSFLYVYHSSNVTTSFQAPS